LKKLLYSSYAFLQGQSIGRPCGTIGKDDKRMKYYN